MSHYISFFALSILFSTVFLHDFSKLLSCLHMCPAISSIGSKSEPKSTSDGQNTISVNVLVTRGKNKSNPGRTLIYRGAPPCVDLWSPAVSKTGFCVASDLSCCASSFETQPNINTNIHITIALTIISKRNGGNWVAFSQGHIAVLNLVLQLPVLVRPPFHVPHKFGSASTRTLLQVHLPASFSDRLKILQYLVDIMI
jgi:hypothetical protein